MYTRPYNEEGHGIIIPESYGGTLLRDDEMFIEKEEEHSNTPPEIHDKNPWEAKDDDRGEEVHKNDDTVETFSFLSRLPFKSFFSDIFKNGNFSLQKIGKEEILIIATAAFLFFSKEGDKECAIMLLLLLFLA